MSVDSDIAARAAAALTSAPETGIHFTCDEADALAAFIHDAAGEFAAAQWLHGHIAGDDDETDHHSADWTEEQTLAHVRRL